MTRISTSQNDREKIFTIILWIQKLLIKIIIILKIPKGKGVGIYYNFLPTCGQHVFLFVFSILKVSTFDLN